MRPNACLLSLNTRFCVLTRDRSDGHMGQMGQRRPSAPDPAFLDAEVCSRKDFFDGVVFR